METPRPRGAALYRFKYGALSTKISEIYKRSTSILGCLTCALAMAEFSTLEIIPAAFFLGENLRRA